MSNPTSPPWLAVELDHRFQKTPAGFHLSVHFEAHAQRTVVFGPSGSGKSSLLRAIAGLLEPDAGHIRLAGKTFWQRRPGHRSRTEIPPERRRIGLVMQNPAVFPHLSVAANVGFALRGMEKSARREKVRSLLQTVDAEPLASRSPGELSGGQLQRVALARTLASQPAALLLDEPFAALDSESRRRLWQSLRQWASEHSVPILTVTHNLEEAFAAGEEVFVMEAGRISAQGPPSQVLATEREQLLRALNASPS